MSEFEYHEDLDLKIQIPAKNLKMKSAQIELKFDFPGFQTIWGWTWQDQKLNILTIWSGIQERKCGSVVTRLFWNQNYSL